ncbi:hypothetical protein Acsp05_57280 [Actinokineospora sp. NBRC 105648]|nr:hypothetical protein Acsp05_57280 [Actinokineospora sp. NBRC 105648]
MVGWGRATTLTGCGGSPWRCVVIVLMVGQKCGDGPDGVVEGVAAHGVAGEGSPVLQVADAVFDADPW